MKNVLIIQSQVKRYRLPFFLKLHNALLANDIRLRVAYANSATSDQRDDDCSLPSYLGLWVRPYRVLGNRLAYFPLLREVATADLVIAEQANSHLHNYLLLLMSLIRCKRVAFWGLGENKAPKRSGLSERIRRHIANKVDWWFAYTNGTKAYLTSNKVPDERITVVRNAIDTQETTRLLEQISDADTNSARAKLGIGGESPVGLFLGALLADKGIALLLAAVEIAKVQLGNLHVIIVGGGPERARVETASREHPWIHYCGPKFGKDKVVLLKLAGALLLPGRVGLAILDGFAAGLPLLTTDVSYHGPEIEYLQSMYNGMISQDTPQAYASDIISFFSNPALRDTLARGARESATCYSIESMVNNFEAGIRNCFRLNDCQIAAVDRTS